MQLFSNGNMNDVSGNDDSHIIEDLLYDMLQQHGEYNTVNTSEMNQVTIFQNRVLEAILRWIFECLPQIHRGGQISASKVLTLSKILLHLNPFRIDSKRLLFITSLAPKANGSNAVNARTDRKISSHSIHCNDSHDFSYYLLHIIANVDNMNNIDTNYLSAHSLDDIRYILSRCQRSQHLVDVLHILEV